MQKFSRKNAIAKMYGGEKYPSLHGIVTFKQTKDGVLVTAEIYGLPTSKETCSNKTFGFHVHSGIQCSGTIKDEFANALGHYNPYKCEHPYHAGDLPPLMENNGNAYMTVLTNRFTVEEVIGRVVIIHLMPDDFKTQPSGNSGEKIACGKIEWK